MWSTQGMKSPRTITPPSLDDNIFRVDTEKHVRKEKDAARTLKKSRWWKNKLESSTCTYCKGNFAVSSLTMDHVVPLSDGGKSTKSNVVVCCKACNTRKKDLPFVDWVLNEEG